MVYVQGSRIGFDNGWSIGQSSPPPVFVSNILLRHSHQPHAFVSVYLWPLLCSNSRVEGFPHRSYGPLILKYLLSGPLQKELAIPDLKSLSWIMSTSGNSPLTPNQMNNQQKSSLLPLHEDSARTNQNLYPNTSEWTYQARDPLAVLLPGFYFWAFDVQAENIMSWFAEHADIDIALSEPSAFTLWTVHDRNAEILS